MGPPARNANGRDDDPAAAATRKDVRRQHSKTLQRNRRRTIAPKRIPQPLRSFVRRQAKDGGLHHVGGLVWLEGGSAVVGAYTVPSGRGEQDGKRFVLRTPVTGCAGKLFQTLGVARPPNIRDAAPDTLAEPADASELSC